MFICFMYLHNFETVDKENQYETVVCEQCGTDWLVDHTLHIMEPLKEVV